MSLLTHVLVPVASRDDATASCNALQQYLEDVERVTALHVIEKGGGSIDKAPMEKRREDAAEVLATVETDLGGAVTVDTRTEFGTDVVETIVGVATASDVTAIAFRPRGGSRIVRLLAGDTATRLVTDPVVPVVSLPNPAVD